MSSLNGIKLRITGGAALESTALPFVPPLATASVVYEIEILILMIKKMIVDPDRHKSKMSSLATQGNIKILSSISFQKILELAYDI